MLKQLERGISEGKIAVGICACGEVLQDRDTGFRKALEGTNFEIPKRRTSNPRSGQLRRGENIIAANPDIVAAVGLCSIDIPNRPDQGAQRGDVVDRRL